MITWEKDKQRINAMKIKINDIESVECIGEFDDEYVYDIEVDDDTHTFFANDILVHNSVYFSTHPITHKLLGTDYIWTPQNVKKVCDEVDSFMTTINNHIKTIIREKLFSPLECIEFARESFSSEADFCVKKKYVLHMRDEEGLAVDKFKYVGVDVKKNEIPDRIKDILKEVIEGGMIDNWSTLKYREVLTRAWDTFKLIDDPNEMAFIKGYGTAKEMTGFMKAGKGAQTHARASEYYNQLTTELKLGYKYEKILVGDKMRFFHVKPNEYGIDCIGFKTKYPTEFNKIFRLDYELMFKKIVLAPLKRFEQNHKWTPIIPGQEATTDVMSL